MPKIPVYEQQLNAPAGVTLDVSSTQTYMPFVNATTNTGDLMVQGAQRMIAQQDNILATSAYTTYLDAAREKRSELLSKESKNGFSLQSEYNDWHTKKVNEITKDSLGVFAQQEIFNKYANNAKESNLDVLASAEAKNIKVARDETTASFASETDKEIRFHAINDAKSDGLIETFNNRLSIDYPGHELGAVKAKYTEALLKSRIESLAVTNPQKGLEVLESRRIELGDSYDKLKKGLGEDLDRKIVNDVYNVLDVKFGNNPEAKLNYIRSPAHMKELGIDLKHKQYLQNVYHGEAALQEANTKKFEIKGKNNDVNAIADMLRKSDVIGALNAINISKFLDNEEKLKLETSIRNGEKNQFEITDPVVYGKFSHIINTDPDSIKSESDIWDFHGKGLSTGAAEKFTTMWEQKRSKETSDEKRMKEVQPARYSSMMKALQKAKFFDSDEVQNDIIYGKIQQQMDNFFISKKDATNDEAANFYDSLTKPYQGNWVEQKIRLFKDFFTPTPVQELSSHNEVNSGPGYGLRLDGTKKGKGFFGEIPMADGNVMTEQSIGVTVDGKERLIPLLVPTLSPDEIQTLVEGGKPTDAMVTKAFEHAMPRIAKGRSPFAEPNDPIMSKRDIAIRYLKENGKVVNEETIRKVMEHYFGSEGNIPVWTGKRQLGKH